MCGPARVPAAPAKEGSSAKGEAGKSAGGKRDRAGSSKPDHGPDDGVPRNIWGDDLTAGEGEEESEEDEKGGSPPAPRAGKRRKEPEEPEEPEADDDDEEVDLEDEDLADDDGNEADGDEEEEADDEADDDAEADEDEDEEDDEDLNARGSHLEFLRERLVSRLKASAERGEFFAPRKLNLGLKDVQLSGEAFARYQKALEAAGDDDPKAAAAAMFEVAMDAAIQTLGAYHREGPDAEVRRLHDRISQRELGSLTSEFQRSAEGKFVDKNPRLARRMAKFFEQVKSEVGPEAALSVPFKTYFRLAGGKLPKRGSKEREDDRRSREEAEERALRQTRTPRDRRPSKGGRAQRTTDVQRAEERYQRYLNRKQELFTLG